MLYHQGIIQGIICFLGSSEGGTEGLIEGDMDGEIDGDIEGETDGDTEGDIDGLIEGDMLGLTEGETDGDIEGLIEGDTEAEILETGIDILDIEGFNEQPSGGLGEILKPGDIEDADGEVDGDRLSLIGKAPTLYKGAAGIIEDS